MVVRNGEIYLEEGHIKDLREEPENVRKRYAAVSKTLAPDHSRITRTAAALLIRRCKRQRQRIVASFEKDVIPGLRLRSRRPLNSPNQTSSDLERKVEAVRDSSGFKPKHIGALVNEGERELVL